MMPVDAQRRLLIMVAVMVVMGTIMVGCRREEPKSADDASSSTASSTAGSTESIAKSIPRAPVADEKPISAKPSEKNDSTIPSDAPVAQARAATATTAVTAAATQAAVELDAPWQPLLRAKPGDWVEYQSRENLRLRYEVQKVTPSHVTTRVTVHQAGRDWGTPAFREDPIQIDFLEQTAMRNKAERTRTSATIEAASRHWECWLYEDRWTDEEVSYIRRSWVSSQVPYSGLVRMELQGDGQLEARLELVAYGTSAPVE